MFCMYLRLYFVLYIEHSMIVYSSVLQHWDECFMTLASKLQEKGSSKWPELNYVAFLEMSEKIFHPHSYTTSTQENIHLIRDCRRLILKHLEDLTSQVVTYCTSIVSLKKMIKLYRQIVDEFKNTPEHAGDAWPMLNSALFMLLDSSGLQDIVSCVVKQMSGHGGVRNEGSDDNLKRSVVRGMTALLMKYGSLVKEKGTIHKK